MTDTPKQNEPMLPALKEMKQSGLNMWSKPPAPFEPIPSDLDEAQKNRKVGRVIP